MRAATIALGVLLALSCTSCTAARRAADYRAGFVAGHLRGLQDAIDALPKCEPPPLPGHEKKLPGDPLTRDL